MDFFSDIGNSILDGLNSVLQSILYNTIYKLCYYIDVGLCWLIGAIYKLFGIFAGTQPVYATDGDWAEETDLFSVFLGDRSINTVYWCMAIVGIALCLAFTIIAVIKKMADLDGKQQRSFGQILMGSGKSILIMLLMTTIMSASISAANAISESVNIAFNAATTSGRASKITYTGEQYATMGRVLNTIGNYSLNPAATSRYNINACFNDIRPDLQWLQEQGVFDFYYSEKDVNGAPRVSWQSELQKVVNAADLRFDLTMDTYKESVAVALRSVMDTMRSDASFKPLKSYESKYSASVLDNTPLDVIVFLMATTEAAQNEAYNVHPSVTDNLRGAYYVGDKSIYDVDEVMGDFDIAIGTFDHILILFAAWFMIPNLVICVFNAIARIFNVLLLYLMAPLALAPMPMDDGGKFKQWTTAFVIQCFSILGIIVSMRLLMLFMPMVWNDNVVFFRSSVVLDTVAKLVLLIGGTEAAKKASGIITGILADNAGIQSIAAGDMSDFAGKTMDTAVGAAKGVAGVAADVTGVTGAKQRLAEKWQRFSEKGGITGSLMGGEAKDVRDARRQREISKKLDKEEQKGKDPDAAAKHNADINADAMTRKFKEAGFNFGGSDGGGGTSGDPIKEALGGGMIGSAASKIAQNFGYKPGEGSGGTSDDFNNKLNEDASGDGGTSGDPIKEALGGGMIGSAASKIAQQFGYDPNSAGGGGGSFGGNKTVPPTSSDEFNNKLNEDKNPNEQENFGNKFKNDQSTSSDEFNNKLNEDKNPNEQENFGNKFKNDQ